MSDVASTFIYWFVLKSPDETISPPKVLIATSEEWFYDRQVRLDKKVSPAIQLCTNPESVMITMIDHVFQTWGGYVRSPTVITGKSMEANYVPEDGGTEVRGIVFAQNEMRGRFDLSVGVYKLNKVDYPMAYIGSFASQKHAMAYLHYRIRALKLYKSNWWLTNHSWFVID